MIRRALAAALLAGSLLSQPLVAQTIRPDGSGRSAVSGWPANGLPMTWSRDGARLAIQLDRLDLKFILHAGSFVSQDIAGQRELVGPEVVIAHRLLKSQARDSIDDSAYALVTDAAAAELEIPIESATPITETHEHYEPVAAHVFALNG